MTPTMTPTEELHMLRSQVADHEREVSTLRARLDRAVAAAYVAGARQHSAQQMDAEIAALYTGDPSTLELCDLADIAQDAVDRSTDDLERAPDVLRAVCAGLVQAMEQLRELREVVRAPLAPLVRAVGEARVEIHVHGDSRQAARGVAHALGCSASIGASGMEGDREVWSITPHVSVVAGVGSVREELAVVAADLEAARANRDALEDLLADSIVVTSEPSRARAA